MIQKFTFNNNFLINGLSSEQKSRLLSFMRKKKYAKNQAIFVEDSYPAGVFFLNSGRVKKFKIDADGREQIIQIYSKGQFFGYSSVLSAEAYSDCAYTIEPCEISLISVSDFHLIIDEIPQFSKSLLKSLSHEFSVMTNIISMLSQRSARERVAISLIILENVYRSQDSVVVDISISKSDIANMAGTTPETLARILHDFKEENLINTRGNRINIKNRTELERESNFV